MTNDMTNEQAILVLTQIKQKVTADTKSYSPMIRQAVVGAIDIGVAAVNKQIPKKPIRKDKNGDFDGNWTKVCPTCGRVLVERITTPEESRPIIYNNSSVCLCGQALDRD